jgi:hypothetical protein
MAERKVKTVAPTGQTVDATDVPVEESTERWSEIRLEDGTIFRIKPVVLAVTRLDEIYDPEGNPFYQVKSNAAIALVSVPENLRRRMN